MEQVSNQLGAIRERRGLSASELAGRAGVSRQTIYAIEAGNYMPNTALALRLARILEVSVEEMFQLASDSADGSHAIAVEPLFENRPVHAGQPVQLCRVGGRTVAAPASAAPVYLPAADAVLVDRSAKSALRLRDQPSPHRLLIAGCDPALSILAGHAAVAGVELALASCNSTEALELLQKGRVHIAGTHLRDEASGEFNLPPVKKSFPRGKVRVVTFASWQQGLVVAPRNPKKIRSAGDLSGKGIRIVNRERGAGGRLMLDFQLREAGVSRRLVTGYDNIATGHLSAAWHVATRIADCCVATEAAARAFGLGFVPIASERFDLVIPSALIESAAVQRLLDAMQRSAFRRALELLGGYDTSRTGQVLA